MEIYNNLIKKIESMEITEDIDKSNFSDIEKNHLNLFYKSKSKNHEEHLQGIFSHILNSINDIIYFTKDEELILETEKKIQEVIYYKYNNLNSAELLNKIQDPSEYLDLIECLYDIYKSVIQKERDKKISLSFFYFINKEQEQMINECNKYDLDRGFIKESDIVIRKGNEKLGKKDKKFVKINHKLLDNVFINNINADLIRFRKELFSCKTKTVLSESYFFPTFLNSSIKKEPYFFFLLKEKKDRKILIDYILLTMFKRRYKYVVVGKSSKKRNHFNVILTYETFLYSYNKTLVLSRKLNCSYDKTFVLERKLNYGIEGEEIFVLARNPNYAIKAEKNVTIEFKKEHSLCSQKFNICYQLSTGRQIDSSIINLEFRDKIRSEIHYRYCEGIIKTFRDTSILFIHNENHFFYHILFRSKSENEFVVVFPTSIELVHNGKENFLYDNTDILENVQIIDIQNKIYYVNKLLFFNQKYSCLHQTLKFISYNNNPNKLYVVYKNQNLENFFPIEIKNKIYLTDNKKNLYFDQETLKNLYKEQQKMREELRPILLDNYEKKYPTHKLCSEVTIQHFIYTICFPTFFRFFNQLPKIKFI